MELQPLKPDHPTVIRLPQRQLIGVMAMVVFLALGHQLRERVLLDDDGHWRQELQTLPWTVQDSAQAGPPAIPKAVLAVPLSINTAPIDSLILLPGVGPVLAQRILDARDSGRIFLQADDLQLVKGIGTKLAARLDTLLAYQSPQTR